MRLRIYIDTSVIGGCEDEEFEEPSLRLMKAFSRAEHVMGAGMRADAQHIAMATVARVDVLVSWNFKHIVRLDKIRLFNAVNIEQGYKPLTIYSPREVISHATEN